MGKSILRPARKCHSKFGENSKRLWFSISTIWIIDFKIQLILSPSPQSEGESAESTSGWQHRIGTNPDDGTGVGGRIDPINLIDRYHSIWMILFRFQFRYSIFRFVQIDRRTTLVQLDAFDYTLAPVHFVGISKRSKESIVWTILSCVFMIESWTRDLTVSSP